MRLPRIAILMILCACCVASANAQFDNSGPGVAMDFVRMFLDQGTRSASQTEQQRAQAKKLIDSGSVSQLDLKAPPGAIDQYNSAVSLLNQQQAKQAAAGARKALAIYPKFVAAHMLLGLIYFDQDDFAHAKTEFEAAAKLDDKLPRAFLNLGILSVSLNDFPSAESYLHKAASLRPTDPNILSVLAYAQFGGQHYERAIETADRVHKLGDKGFASVHYTSADAAAALQKYDVMERELKILVREDPTNAFTPVARQHLQILAKRKQDPASALNLGPKGKKSSGSESAHTIPNSNRLKAELGSLGPEGTEESGCEGCSAQSSVTAENRGPSDVSDPDPFLGSFGRGFTIRKSVDQVALYFAVSHHGQMVDNLSLSDLHIFDDGKAPETLEQFVPQAKLPLRLALVIDVSGSVKDRFAFEKHAAAKFVEKMLVNPSDLGFVLGFGNDIEIAQDFTGNAEDLGNAVEKLNNGGGTRLFDAISLACGKLAAYPEHERVARVVVVLSDGEDNSSHRSLKQVLQEAENSGVAIYTVSTKDGGGSKTDADKVLEALAERSGGEALFAGDVSVLNQNLSKLRELIRSRYLLAYKPANFMPDGRYRTIKITAEKDGKRLRVHVRKGYYARREAPIAKSGSNDDGPAN